MRELNIPEPTKLIESLPIGLALCKMDGSLVYANLAFASIIGYLPDELLGLTCWQLTPEKYAEKEQNQLEKLKKTGRCGPYEKEYIHKNGRLVPVRLNSEIVEVDGEPHIWSSVEMVADILAFEKALGDSERKFRTLFESANDALILLSRDGRIMDINEIGHSRLGYTKEEMLGRSIADFDPPEFSRKVPERFKQMVANGQAKFESAHVRKDGSIMPIEVSARTFEMDGTLYVFSVVRDISKRKEMTDRVRERDAMYRAVFETSADGFWVVDMQGRFLEVNDAYVKMSGYSREELLGMRVPDVEAKEKPEETAAHIEKILRDGHDRFESLHRKKSGEVWPVEIVTTYWAIGDGRIFVFIIDISERKQTEARLHKLSEAVERGGEAVMITDHDATIEYVNPAFTHITGYTADEVIGEKPSILKSSAQNSDFYKELWDTITQGKVWRGTLVDQRKDGSFYPTLMSVAPILDEAGEVRHYIAVQQDMSEYKRLEQQFHQAQKMEALGTLVGGIAHDFNNMLAGIVGNTYLLKRRAKGESRLMDGLETIDKLCGQATAMIKQLLTYAKAEQIEPKTFLLNEMVHEALELSEAAIPESVERVIDIGTDAFYVHGDAIQLQQAMINILNNARDAVGGRRGAKICCSLTAFVADSAFRQCHPECKGENFARLTIKDNGCGISEDVLGKIFDPFFTTKGVDRGNGLGLAMVYGAIENHRGVIEVESRPEEGTTFAIYLPVVQKEQESPPVLPEEVSGGGQELIIVADDEEHVRQMYADLLQELGYRVKTAVDGEDAIRVYEENRAECAMIILDVVMPKMGGVEAAREIRRNDRETPILFATGYDKDVALGKLGNEMVNYHVISKPFEIDHLIHTIRQMIDARQKGT